MASIILKVFLAATAMLILAATTPFMEIGNQLARLRTPKLFCLQLLLTYRYLATLLEEAYSMSLAYALRAPGQKGIRLKDAGSFLGQLILRSADRAERLYQAMKCRGFDGVYRGVVFNKMRFEDVLFMSLSVFGIIFLRLINMSLFIGKLAG